MSSGHADVFSGTSFLPYARTDALTLIYPDGAVLQAITVWLKDLLGDTP